MLSSSFLTYITKTIASGQLVNYIRKHTEYMVLAKSCIKFVKPIDIWHAYHQGYGWNSDTNSCTDPENFLRGGPSSQKGSDGKFQHGKN